MIKSLKKIAQERKVLQFFEKISDKEYEHILKVWDKFEMKTMRDFHNLYLNGILHC